MPRSSHIARSAGAAGLSACIAISLTGCTPLWDGAVTLSRVDLDKLTPVG